MIVYSITFYVIAAIILISTLLAITSRQLVNAVVYLILSFIATAVLFYLLGAPFLAALEIILYAGAIMVLFLFIVMTLRVEQRIRTKKEILVSSLPVLILAVISLIAGGILIYEIPGYEVGLKPQIVSPAAFGHFLFQNYWFPVEIASFLLLIGLVGTLYLGRQDRTPADEEPKKEL